MTHVRAALVRIARIDWCLPLKTRLEYLSLQNRRYLTWGNCNGHHEFSRNVEGVNGTVGQFSVGLQTIVRVYRRQVAFRSLETIRAALVSKPMS